MAAKVAPGDVVHGMNNLPGRARAALEWLAPDVLAAPWWKVL